MCVLCDCACILIPHRHEVEYRLSLSHAASITSYVIRAQTKTNENGDYVIGDHDS